MTVSRWTKPVPERPPLDKMVQAANEVAQTARTLLASMLAAAITLSATMIAATDEALFRDAAKVFPSLGVEIRLSTAYTLAPPLFWFLHVNALVQLHLLAKRLRALDVAIGQRHADRAAWRGQVHGIAFAQLLTGESDGNLHRPLLLLITVLAVAVIPVALLLTAQISFLRYQSETITRVHQVVLFLDLGVLLWFGENIRRAEAAKWPGRLAAGLFIALLETVSWQQAVPIEHPERPGYNLFDDRLCRTEGFHWTCRWLDLSNHVLINTDAKPDLLAVFGGGEEVQAEARRKMTALALAGRNFRRGRFDGAQLFSADLSGAHFEGAWLYGANLRESNLNGAHLQQAVLSSAQFVGADMLSANFDGADLESAQLQGAHLTLADFRGANLVDSKLQGTGLVGADLRGALLMGADLRGTDFSGAQLQGANLELATLTLARGDHLFL